MIVGILSGFRHPGWGQQSRQPETNLFRNLSDRLRVDGFDGEFVSSLYDQGKVEFDGDTVSLFFVHNESRLNYDQFTLPENISIAREYMASHSENLSLAEKTFAINPEIITAILLVETRLGSYIGKSSILDTLSTMASLSDSFQRDYLWDNIPKERRIERLEYEKKAKRKSQWAYGELKAFLEYTTHEKISPTDIRGSYAGAMGISQFMPSNILKLGMDGNNDGRVDLFDHADAIMSVANYLHYHGWHEGIGKKEAYSVILRYNNSQPYATTILKIADILESSL